MNVVCYLCNEPASDWRANFVELYSKHTKTGIIDLFKRFLADFPSQRIIDDDSNRICVKCLDKIDDYDLMLATVAEKEITLRRMLFNTERFFNSRQNQDESEVTAFGDHLDEKNVIEKKSIKSSKESREKLKPKEKSKEKSNQQAKTNEQKAPKKCTSHISSNDQEVLASEKMKKPTVKLMKPATGLKPDSSALKLKSNSESQPTADEVKANALKLQTIKSIFEKHIKHSEGSKPNEIKLRAPAEPRTQCLQCNDNVWYTRFEYQFHLHQQHLTCYLCNMTFTSLDRSKRHMEWHNTSAGLLCRVCHHQLTDKQSYEMHLKLHNKSPKYECVLCGKDNKNSARLKSHVNTHDDIMCSFCGKRFKRRDECDFHERRHREYPAAFQHISFLK